MINFIFSRAMKCKCNHHLVLAIDKAVNQTVINFWQLENKLHRPVKSDLFHVNNYALQLCLICCTSKDSLLIWHLLKDSDIILRKILHTSGKEALENSIDWIPLNCSTPRELNWTQSRLLSNQQQQQQRSVAMRSKKGPDRVNQSARPTKRTIHNAKYKRYNLGTQSARPTKRTIQYIMQNIKVTI